MEVKRLVSPTRRTGGSKIYICRPLRDFIAPPFQAIFLKFSLRLILSQNRFMKKILPLILVLCSVQLMAQNTLVVQDRNMVHANDLLNAEKALLEMIECGEIKIKEKGNSTATRTPEEDTVPLGSSGNWYSIVRSSSNMVSADNDLNSVVFIHRNDPSTLGDGNVSHYRLDISNDGGQTWANDIGPINPSGEATASATGVPNSRHRYPQVQIMNSGGNTDPASGYLFYCGATHDQEGDSPWDGTVSGGSNLLGDASSFSENLQIQNDGNVIIPSALSRAGDNALWATDITGSADNSLILYKANWDGTSGTMNVEHLLDPKYDNTDPDTEQPSNNIGIWQIGFDEAGINGYAMSVGDAVFPGCDELTLTPLYFKTTDGGASWDGPHSFNMNNWSGGFPAELEELTFDDGTTISTIPNFLYTSDMEIDANGDPHFAVLVSGLGVGDDGEYVGYNLFPGIIFVVDLHYSTADNEWRMTSLAQVGDYFIDELITGGQGNVIGHGTRLQITASADKTKMFVTWGDSEPDATTRDLLGIGIDVNTKMTTELKNFTATNADWAGQIYYGSASSSALQSGSTHTVPYIFAQPEDFTDGGDLLPIFYHYYQNCTFDDSEFTQPAVNSLYVPAPPVVGNIVSSGGGIAYTFTGDIEGACEFLWDFGDGETSTEESPGHLFPNEDSSYTVTLTATNFDGTSTSTADVVITSVVDNVAPVITLSVGNEITVDGEPNGEFVPPTYEASDDVGGQIVDVTSFVTIEGEVDITTLGQYTLVYTVTDGTNTTSETLIVNVVDNSPPVIQVDGPSTVTIICGAETVELPAFNPVVITDNFDGQIYNSSEGGETPWNANEPGVVDLNTPGNYEVTITVSDSAGNVETETLVINVLPCTGIEDVFGTSVQLFPNPVQENLYINTTDEMSAWTIHVYDLQGRVLKTVVGEGQAKNTINMASWSEGMYLINVITPDASATERIVLGK